MTHVYATRGVPRALETTGAWLLGLLWLLPLAYAVWTAFHPAEFSTRFVLTRAAHAGELREGMGGGAVRALFPQHDGARSRWCSRRSSCW